MKSRLSWLGECRDAELLNLHIKCADWSVWRQELMDTDRRKFERTASVRTYLQRRCARNHTQGAAKTPAERQRIPEWLDRPSLNIWTGS